MTGAATGAAVRAAVRAAVGAGAEENCVGAVLMALMSEDSRVVIQDEGVIERFTTEQATAYPTNWRDPLNCGGKGSGECARFGLRLRIPIPAQAGIPTTGFLLTRATTVHASSRQPATSCTIMSSTIMSSFVIII